VSIWRTEATTARRTASRSRARPAALRPTRPLPRAAAAEAHVLIGPAALLACPATGAQIGVGETLLRGLFDRGRLGQDALPLIAIASRAPAHHDGGQSAGLRGAPGERGIAGRQKLEVAEICAVQTQCTCLVLEKEVAGVVARRARPRVLCGEITMICRGRRGRSTIGSGMSVDAQWVR